MELDKTNTNPEEFFRNLPDNFNIIEDKINVNLQLEYYENSVRVKKTDLNEDEILNNSHILFNKNPDIEAIKYYLNQLASIDKPEAYRIIEKYLNYEHNILIEWTKLAFNESKMLLESSFTNENKVIISSGLGGKENKLRFFMVFFNINELDFNDTQKKVLRNELETTSFNNDGIIEKIEFNNQFCLITFLMPIKNNLKSIFQETIRECNVYGNFLKNNFLITNIKELNIDEIKEIVKNKKK